MKIYTKGGDQGDTGLVGGDRVPKDNLRIRTYGTLDELNTVLGLFLAGSAAATPMSDLRKAILRIQGELFQLGAELATPRGKKVTTAFLDLLEVQKLEVEIDEMEKVLEPLQNFILPGGFIGSAYLHFARAISRRAERELVTLNRAEPVRPVVLQYVNRLSDHLFVAARFVNHHSSTPDIAWHAPKVK